MRITIMIIALSAAAAGLLSAQDAAGPRELYRSGLAARDEERFFNALEFFSEALKRNPAYLDPIIASSEIYELLEEYEQALVLADRALALARDNTRALALKGRILLSLGRSSQAGEIFDQLLRLEPNNLDARVGKGLILLADNKLRGALGYYKEAFDIDPINRRVLLSLALLHESLGESAAAGRYLEAALRHHGEEPRVRYEAGRYFMARGRLKEAEAEARAALSINEGFDDARVLLGQVLFRRAREAGPTGEAGKGLLAEAARETEKALRANRKNAGAWYLRAQASAGRGEFKTAIDSLRSLLREFPEDEVARITLEDILNARLAKEDPERQEESKYHLRRAGQFKDRYFFQKALYEFRRALQLYDSKEARSGFGEMLYRTGFPARALFFLSELQKQKKDDARIGDMIENLQSAVSEGPAARWRLDQMEENDRRARLKVSVFHDSGRHRLLHEDGAAHLAGFFSEYLRFDGRLEVAVGQPEAGAVKEFNEAFRAARQAGSDFFIMLEFAESPKEFAVQAELYITRTGARIKPFTVYRTGNDRVQGGLLQLVEKLAMEFPFRAEIIRREFDRVAMNAGRSDAVKKDDEYLIVSSKNLQLKHDKAEFIWSDQDVLGTLKVLAVDDLAAEGAVKKKGFFDMINPGDFLVKAPAPPVKGVQPQQKAAEAPGSTSPAPPLYLLLRRLQ